MASTTFIIGDGASENIGSDPLQVQVTITDGDFNDDGVSDLQVNLEVVSGFAADLRGFFFNVADNSLLSKLTVTGDDITATAFDTDNDGVPEIDSVGGGGNVITPGGPFEAGVEIGDSGIGMGDDFPSTTFVISTTDDTPLSLLETVGEDIGIRATSVGENREGSSKLTGEVPPPPNPDPDPEPDPEPETSVNFDKDIDISVDFDFTSNVDINFDKDVNIDVSVDSDVDIEDNVAMLTFSVEAFGENTLAEADVHVLATDTLSSVDGIFISAVS